jgi:uncharacterized protein YyaL (SSP411 family)
MLCVTNALVSPSQEVAVVGAFIDPATQALLAEVRRHFMPNTVLAAAEPGDAAHLPLLEGRGLVNGKPAAYVCENYACKLPVTTVEALAELL